MKIPSIRRILKEDLAKAGPIPPWVDNLLDPLNEFIDTVVTSLRSNLTFADNFLAKEFSAEFTDAVAIKVNAQQNKNRVYGIVPIASGDKAIDSFSWSRNTDGTVSVTFGFTTAGSAQCTIIIFYGA